MLRSDLCVYSNAYIILKGRTGIRATTTTDIGQRDIAFKNNVSFRSCITKINSTLIDNAEGLDIVMPMYNLLEYSQNYSMTSGSLGNYYRDEIDDVDANSLEGKPFKYKTKIVEKTETRADQTGNEVDADREDQPPLPTLNT